MSNEVTHNQTWEQAIARTQNALKFLQTTADDVATSRTIDSDDRAEAITVAKRLVTELVPLGFAEAAQHAQNLVATLDHAGLPQPERLQQQVSALQASLASALED